MALGPRLEFRQTQSLVMTPQLRQAIKLLQFSNQEVIAFVEQELERNPLLERDEVSDRVTVEAAAPDQRPERAAGEPDAADQARAGTLPEQGADPLDVGELAERYDAGGPSDGGPGAFPGNGRGGAHDFDQEGRDVQEMAENPPTLREQLGEQLRLSFPDPIDRMIGAHLIALLSPAGRLTAEPAAVARAMGIPFERVEAVRGRMMRFDPVGLFARDLRECLAVQLAEQDRLDPAMATMLDNLDALARRDLRHLMVVCGVDAEDIVDMIAEIRKLDPKPGAAFEHAPLQTVIPDVLMRANPDGTWLLELNPETLPRVLVNQSFYAKVTPRAPRETRAFLSEQLQTANWLVKSLQQRAHTILKVATEIMLQQEGFLRHGVAHLRPIILRDIAEAVEMHESTVSRVTANKYIATPRGTFELKYFFTTAIAGISGETYSAEAIRHRIRGMIGAERAESVLSDDAIVLVLRGEGVDIARRTVAKYREALRIPSSVQRKREKAVPA